MPDQPIHSVSVAGVVVDEAGRVLVIQRRDNDRWEPPGGILERDETFEEGVIREVLEETGVEVEVERLTGVYKNMTRGIVALVYRCRPRTTDAAPTTESAAVDWIPANQVSDLMDLAYAIRIHDALDEGLACRVHDGTHIIETDSNTRTG